MSKDTVHWIIIKVFLRAETQPLVLVRAEVSEPFPTAVLLYCRIIAQFYIIFVQKQVAKANTHRSLQLMMVYLAITLMACLYDEPGFDRRRAECAVELMWRLN